MDDNLFGDVRSLDLRQRTYEFELISNSGLFDVRFYLAQNPDITKTNLSPVEHFLDFGCGNGSQPNFYFDPAWYLTHNPDVREAGINPLAHYISHGDIEGRKPSLVFDAAWYRTQHKIPRSENALSHYLRHRTHCTHAPIAEFDIEHYARSYPDVVAAAIDPFEHFVAYGYREGRTPSTSFDAKFYWARYLGNDANQNPYLHFLAHKHEPGIHGRMPDSETSIPREIRKFTHRAPEFEEYVALPASAPRRAKLLAYYLPQFHAIAENDEWWGKGFTEWTNIARGLPRFRGHYQPRIPRDLGFYSLDHRETMKRQVDMAKGGGVYGFIFYYYWFNGKRLLNKPVDHLLGDRTIKMPFCLMWANENWTRRWDGADAEILISQDYRVEDEANLIEDFARHFSDPRYIRIGGRPLLMIYRPGLIVDATETLSRWRDYFKKRFNEHPLLVMGQTFRAVDPADFGMDGAIEFPPHKLTQDMPAINPSLEYLDLEYVGKAYRYADVAKISVAEPPSTFPLIKTIVPSWDNDARRQGNGIVLTDSTPQKYQAWLGELVDNAVRHPFFGEPIVCVNAWNEWCEAAYLEPDLHYGAAYLNATGRALIGETVQNSAARMLLVGHDAFPSGAQHLLLNIGRTLRSNFGVAISFILLQGGKMEEEYRAVGPVTLCNDPISLQSHCLALKTAGFTTVIANSSAAASSVPVLKKLGFDVTLLVHELPLILREKHLSPNALIGAQQADRVIFPAKFVLGEFCAEVKLQRENDLLVIPQGSYKTMVTSKLSADQIQKEFGVRKNHRLVIGVGYADLRKGFDFFVQLWRMIRSISPLVTHFCWIGAIDPVLEAFMSSELEAARSTGTFHTPGFRSDVSAIMSGAHAFALTSREDPFPSVALEALSAGLPLFVFDKSGGIPELIRGHPLGHVIPFADTVAMAQAIASTIAKPTSESAKRSGHQMIARDFDFASYVWRLLELPHRRLPQTSVAVPNFNYARYLPGRLSSIFLQTQPIRELLMLDDCSTDNSLDVTSALAREWNREVVLMVGRVNSGSVFRQWRKAAEAATGEFIWLAEADDLCDPTFLHTIIEMMKHEPSVHFAFCDSCAINADGSELWPDYKTYYSSVAPNALASTEIFEADDFAVKFMSIKNLILNASAVIWRRAALLRAMKVCESDLDLFKSAGDWRLYLQMLSHKGSRIGYCKEVLNKHRRHAVSVTRTVASREHVAEIAACQSFARSNFRLSPEVVLSQKEYLVELSQQLSQQPDDRRRVARPQQEERRRSARSPLHRHS